MKRNEIFIKAFNLAFFNSITALLILFYVKKVLVDFNIFDFLYWIEEDTKRFVLYFSILCGSFLSIAKYQLKLFDLLKVKYPKILIVFKYIFIVQVSWTAAFVVNYCFQYFHYLKDPILTIEWIEQNNEIFLTGVVYLLFLFLFTFALIGNIYVSTLFTSAIFIAIGFVHYNKLNIRVEPLYPLDYKQITLMREVIPMISQYISFSQIYWVFMVILFLGVMMRFLPKIKVHLYMRGIILLAAFFMTYSFTYFPKTFMKNFVEKNNITITKWDQTENYQLNGFLFGFISNLQNDTFEKPKSYSKQRVLEVAQKYVSTSKDESRERTQSPNIVFLMSESFWDPTKLNLQFSEDPIPNLNQLKTEHSSGEILSPAFGGATANVEFEALTGFTTAFLKNGVIPYQDIISNKQFVPTIVSDLENKGYQTLAIHPFNRMFYRRNNAYKTFGINKFLDDETMENRVLTPRGIISDKSLSDEILDNIEKQEDPIFIHAISMQNHMPYQQGAFEDNMIQISGLTPELTSSLEVYTEGISRSDEALRFLVNRLDQLNEPTIVVFWGDHLPIFGTDMAVYNEAKYLHKDKKVNSKITSETPLLIYTNFETEQRNLNTISPFFLGPIVYEFSGMEKPPFYYLLNQVKKEIPAMKTNLTIGNDQQIVTKLTSTQKKLLNDYRLIEYDLLMGKQYSMKLMYPEK